MKNIEIIETTKNKAKFLAFLKLLMALGVAFGAFACSEKKVDPDKNFPAKTIWSTKEFASPNDRVLNGAGRNLIEFVDDKTLFVKIDNGCFKDLKQAPSLQNLDDPNKFVLVYKFSYKYSDNWVQIFSGQKISNDPPQNSYNSNTIKSKFCSSLDASQYEPTSIEDVLNLQGRKGFILKKDQKELSLVLKNRGQNIFNRIK